MSDQSAIEWTDATWNPVRGCTKVSPGCAHCYAETFAERFRGVANHPYEQGFDLRLVPEKLDEPLKWKKPRRVFVNSMSDLFQDGVPDHFITRAFAVMALAPQHTFQVLTKRADRMREYMNRPGRAADVAVEVFKRFTVLREADVESRRAVKTWPLPNVWLGVSVENQHFADERVPLLLQTPAAVRFISAEPLLGPVNLSRFLTSRHSDNPETGSEHSRIDGEATPIAADTQGPANMEAAAKNAGAIRQEADRREVRNLDWVIVGGESGLGARPFDVSWARSIVVQCQAAGVPVFMKQLGADPVRSEVISDVPGRFHLGLKDRKGGDMSEWPEDLRVREFPR